MHSDILVLPPQQHTIHVVVSCIFHNLRRLVSYSSTVFSLSLFVSNLLPADLTDHMNVSLGKWDSDPNNEAFMWVRGREVIE